VSGSAECEAIRLDACIAELDLDEALGDLSRLADHLVRARVANRAAAVRAHISAVCVGCELTVEEHPELDRRPGGGRSHHEVDIARSELVGDSSPGLVQDGRMARDSP